MNKNLPQNSNISIVMSNGIEKIIIPEEEEGISKYFSVLFLVLWIFGWAIGFLSAGTQILSGNGSLFLFFWFAIWTLIGLSAVSSLFNIFKKATPESLVLNRLNLLLYTPTDNQIEFNHKELETLTLRETDFGNRLTIDKEAERIELAISATEIEREWIFEYLKFYYKIDL